MLLFEENYFNRKLKKKKIHKQKYITTTSKISTAEVEKLRNKNETFVLFSPYKKKKTKKMLIVQMIRNEV